MAIPPKYTYSDLQDILGSNPQLPDQLNEEGFIYDIKNNTKVKWRVNHFLFRRELLALIVDERAVRNWKIGRSLNWLVVLFVAGLSIWTGDYKLLLFLLVYPFIILPVDHWIFIFNVALFIGVKFLFSFNIQYFWLLMAFVVISYSFNKAIDEKLEKKILAIALHDWSTFWKFYSNRMIWMDKSALNNEYEKLNKKYPELGSF